jgi:hypothetical protein
MPPFLLAWERLLWSGRPGPLAFWRRVRFRYYVTDCRVVVTSRSGAVVRELLLDEVATIELTQTRAERLAGTSTVVITARAPEEAPIELADIRQGPQLALVLQLRASDRFGLDHESEFFAEALRSGTPGLLKPALLRPVPLAGAACAAVAAAVVLFWHPGMTSPVRYPADDAIAPDGVRRDRAAIVRFMQSEVMPVARRVLGPIKGGPERVSCETCHGTNPQAQQWKMPAVRALPEPEFRLAGLERFNRRLDPQIRNAIYGYLAKADKQTTAAYMRSVVMPAMAQVLGRPAYDFTRSYEYNRVRAAIGCYHCHQVDGAEGG